MNQKKVSVHGLQNIGMLLGRADAPTPAPNRERRDINGIFNHTRAKVEAAVGLAPDGREQTTAFKSQRELLKTYINAGLREAYNLGHSEALEQNGQVERLLEKQYETRTRVTTPAVVCAVMEQIGLSSMTLDMAMMATVFDRCDIQYTVSGEDVIEFTMRPIGAFTDGALGEPLGELDPGLAFDLSEFDNDQPTREIDGIPHTFMSEDKQ